MNDKKKLILSFLIFGTSVVQGESPTQNGIGMYQIYLGDSYERVAERLRDICPGIEIPDPPAFPMDENTNLQTNHLFAGNLATPPVSGCSIPGDAAISTHFTQWRTVRSLTIELTVAPEAVFERLENRYGPRRGLKNWPYWRTGNNRYQISARYSEFKGGKTRVTVSFLDMKPEPTKEYLRAMEKEKESTEDVLDGAF